MYHPTATLVFESYITRRPFDLEIEMKQEIANNAIRNFLSIAHLKQPQAQKHLLSQQIRMLLAMDDDTLAGLPLNPLAKQLAIAPTMSRLFKEAKPLFDTLRSCMAPAEFNEILDKGVAEDLPRAQASIEFIAAQGRRLPDLLEEFEMSETSDPRDRLFALLSLSSDSDNTLLKPDYRESPTQVMMRYASFFIEQEGLGVTLLASAGHAFRAAFGDRSSVDWMNTLPSWIPDWMKPFSKVSGILKGHQIWSRGSDHPKFFAAGNSTSSMHLLPDRLTLSVRGAVIDTISCVIHKTNSDVFDVRAAVEYWKRADALIAEKYPDYPFSTRSGRRIESIQELQRRTLIADFDAHERNLAVEYNESRAFLKRMDDALNLYDAGVLTSSQIEEFLLSAQMEKMHNFVSDYWSSWSGLSVTHDLVGTHRGLVGLAPHGVAVGDSVALLSGAFFPFVIRQAGSTTKTDTAESLTTYHLIGGAYMHGIMQGEVVRSDWWKEEDMPSSDTTQ